MRKTISLPTLPSQAIGINIYLHEKTTIHEID